MSTAHKIKMVTYYVDGGDGSSSISFYNSPDELKNELIKGYQWDEERWQALLSGDDPYENGSLDSTTVTVNVNDDGSISIAPFYAYSGNQ